MTHRPAYDAELKIVKSAGADILVTFSQSASSRPGASTVLLLPGLIVGEYLWKEAVPELCSHGHTVASLHDPTASVAGSLA
jgi:hypothetical protein